jgi:hypothetical protein
MAEEFYQEPEKSVEELAREAMDAIKAAERRDQIREQEELKAKEDALKQEVENRIRSKMRKLQREQEKDEKNRPPEIDTRFMVTWQSGDDGRGFYYEGEYNEKLSFTIKKGINLYHLYVVNSDLMIEAWQKSTCTSIDLTTLKEKADKILKEATQRAKEKKEQEKKNSQK